MSTTLKEEEANWAMEVPRPDVSHLVTEDDTPVDNVFHEKQMRLLTHPLYASWDPGQPFGAMANVGLFISTYVPPLVPDVLVTLGVPVPPPAAITRKERGSYFMWLYGKAPDIVVEIVSNKEGGELDRKREGYARFTVPYYVVFDPDLFIQDQRLRSYRLNGGEYEPMEENRFPKIGLGLVEWEGEFENEQDNWLRWVDASGTLIPTGEERAQAETERARAETERAESEAKRARKEARRAKAAIEHAETATEHAEVEAQRAKAAIERAEAEARRASTEARRAKAEAQRAKIAIERAEAEAERTKVLAAKLRELGVDPDSIAG